MNLKFTPLKTVVLLLCLLLGSVVTRAQLSGTISVPSATYPSIDSAVKAINAQGVGTGGVTVNIAAGYTEALAARITLTATGTATAPIVFQKSGTGANPLITAYVGTNTATAAAMDGMWALVGSDYVTINGINLTDPATNTTDVTTMEYGYGLFKASAADGAKNNVIKNCVITLNRANFTAPSSGPAFQGSNGIVMLNCTPVAMQTSLTITAATGSSSYNAFYSNTIQNCNNGIALSGYAAPAPYTLADTANDIGGSTAATGNTIINFGGGTSASTAAGGVFAKEQWGLNVSYNTINSNNGSGVNHVNVLRGIFLNSSSAGASANVTYNTITVRSGGTTTALEAIESAFGSGGTNNTINISNNTITNCTYLTATSGVFYGIWNNGASPAKLIINANTLVNDSTSATSGSYYNIYNSGAVTVNTTITNNTVNVGTFTAASTSMGCYNIYNTSTGASDTITISNNVIQNAVYTGATGATSTFACIYNSATASTGLLNVQNNVLNNLSIKNTAGTVYLFYLYNGTPFQNVTGNRIATAFVRNGVTSGSLYGLYNTYGTYTAGVSNISGNNLSNITSNGTTGSYYMLYWGQSATQNIFNDTISNFTSTGTGTFYGLYPYYYAVTCNVYNNVVSNVTFGGTVYGLYYYGYYHVNANVYGNLITGLTTSGATMKGISIYYTGGGAAIGNYNFYKNKITDLTSTSSSGVVSGIIGDYNYYGGTIGIYNNYIGNLFATTSTNGNAVNGINLASTTSASGTPLFNISYNTVNITGTSTGSGFGANAMYVSTTKPVYTVNNNILVNAATATGSGVITALRLPSTSLANFGTTSNNNLLYAGVPGGSNMLMYDGTNSYPTLTLYKAAVAPRENSSISEIPNYASTTSSAATYLHINPAISTAIEGGAVNISGITDDYDADIRAGNPGYLGSGGSSPDIGADEFNGTTPALSILSVARTPAANSCTAVSRAVTASIKIGNVALTSVTLNYSLNGTAQTPITMTLSVGTNTPGSTTTWTGTIPAAVPANAVVAWSVAASDGVYSKSAAGTGYQDNPLLGYVITASATPASVCSGYNDTLRAVISNPAATMPTGYCTSGAGNTSDEEITNVTFGTINNTSTCASLTGTQGTATGTADIYSDWTASTVPVPTVNAGATYPINVTVTECGTGTYSHMVVVYIDLNRNGSLLDAGESFTIWPYAANGMLNVISSSITIPATASIGTTLMRVVCKESSAAAACGFASWGETEDYKIQIAGNAGFTYAWTAGSTNVGSTNPLILNPTATTSYSVTATDVNGCSISSAPATATVLPVLNVPNGVNSTQCGPHVPSCSVSSGSSSSSPIFRWYLTATGGTALAGQTGSTLSNYTIYATTTFYVSEVNTNGCESGRKAVTATITAPPALTTTAPSIGICTGASIALTTGSSVTGTNYTYSWMPGSLSGSPVTVSPTATTKYYVTATSTSGTYAGCIALDSINVYVSPQPPAPTITPSAQTICQNSPAAIVATPAGFGVVATLGTGTLVNTTSSYPSPFGQFYGSSHEQYLILASELSNLGVQAGNITSIAFDLQTGYSYAALSNYAVKMAPTTNTNMSGGLITTGFTTVYSAATYTPPSTTGWATSTFTTPFVWDGVSNVVVDVSFSNCSVCNGTSSCTTSFTNNGLVNQTATSFVSAYNVRYDNNCTINTMTPSGSTITATFSQRPNMRFNASKFYPVSWTNATSLFRNTALTNAIVANVDTATTVYASPVTVQNYTAVSNVLGCLSVPSNTSQVNVIAAPPSTITPATAQAKCIGDSATFTGPVGANLTYQWYNGTTLIAGATNISYTAGVAGNFNVKVTNTLSGCSATSTAVPLTINPLPVVTITPASTTTFCNGGNVVLNGTSGLTNYQWINTGSNITAATTNAYTATTSGSYTLKVTNSNGCINTSAPVTVTVNTTPSAITPSGSTTFCTGGSVVLNAPAPPAGTTFTYQWQFNGNNVSTAAAYTANTSGNYTVTVTNTNTGCIATTTPATVVTVGPPPSSAITPSGTVGICQGYSTLLTANQSAGLTYQWMYNGTPIPAGQGGTNSTFPATQSGSYTVTVSIAGASGCNSTTTTPTATVINPLPAASATAAGATTVCQGNTVILNANQGSGLSYQWQNNGTNVATAGNNLSYAAVVSGNYSVVVTNPITGCFNTSTLIPVTVNPLPAAAITAAGSTIVCAGNPVTITANTGANLSYSWNQNGVAVVPAASSFTYSAGNTGSYTATVTNTATGCVNTSNAIPVTVNPLPNVTTTPSGNVNLCTGSTLTINLPVAASQSYQWKKGGVNVTGATTNSYATTVADSYTAFVTNLVTGCTATSAPVVVTIVPLPQATVSPATASTACDSLTLTANSGTGLSYQWLQNNLPVAGATSLGFTAVASGAYTVKVTNTNGCVQNATPVNVTINPSPVSTITYTSPLVFCDGGAVALNCYTTNGLTYQWLKNGVNIQGATTNTNVSFQTGVYSVLVTNSYGCTKASPTVTVQVNALPTPAVTVNNYTLSTGTYVYYQWYRNSQPIPGAIAQNYTVSQNGGYYVAVTDSSGCVGVSPLKFYNNVGVQTMSLAGIKLYPNPTRDFVNIESPIPVNIVLRDMAGRIVMKQEDVHQLDLGKIANGVYMIQIRDKYDNLIKTDKIFKVE